MSKHLLLKYRELHKETPCICHPVWNILRQISGIISQGHLSGSVYDKQTFHFRFCFYGTLYCYTYICIFTGSSARAIIPICQLRKP